MAKITRLTLKEGKSGSTRRDHSEVEATYFFTDDGYLQIDSYGSSDRQDVGDPSQSMQFSPEMIRKLMRLFRENGYD